MHIQRSRECLDFLREKKIFWVKSTLEQFELEFALVHTMMGAQYDGSKAKNVSREEKGPSHASVFMWSRSEIPRRLLSQILKKSKILRLVSVAYVIDH
jgi:hypothetical protein